MIGLAEWLEWHRGATVAVVGVGNRLRRDDGAGSHVAERLRAAGHEAVFDAETVPENFLGPLLARAPAVVLFVDAAELGGSPGECRLASVDELAPRLATTHAPSLRLLAGLLERHGVECRLLGIQPASTAPGMALSPEVACAVERVAATVDAGLAREAHRA